MASQASGLPPGFVLDPVTPAPPVYTPPATERRGRPRLPAPQTDVQRALEEERLRRERAETELARTRAERITSDPAGDSPGEQRRVAGFYLRAARANTLYEQHQVEPRGIIGQTLADTFPRLANQQAAPERQVAEADQRDFVSAVLRFETGANMPPAEVEEARIRYFPQPGDSPEVIAEKARLRINALDGLRNAAGPAAHGLDASVAPGQSSPSWAFDAGAEAARATAQNAQGGPGGTPPSSGPPDPNRVQPGETMGSVGTLPVGDPQSGDRLALTEGERFEIDPRAPQVGAQFTAALRRGAGRDELLRIIGQLGPVSIDQRAWIDAAIQPRNRSYWRTNNPIPPGFGRRPRTQAEQTEQAVGDVLSGGGALKAGVASALDSASLGLPALFSSDYRQRMGMLREEHPIASTVGAVVGGVVAPGGPRVGMGLAQQTRRSAFQGGVYGFNESGGNPVAGITGAGIGAAVPGAFNVAGRGLRAAPRAFRLGGNYADEEAQALAQSLTEEGIQGSRPLLDPSTRTRTAYLESQRGSGGPIRRSLAATREGVEAGVERIGAGGTVESPRVMGQRVQDAGRRYIATSRVQATRMYDHASELAGDTRIVPVRASQVLHRNISELAEVPGGVPKVLTDLQDSLISPDLGFTVSGLRNLRTRLRDDFAERGLVGSDTERRAMQVVDALSEDIQTGLTQAGRPDAAQAYAAADRFYAERRTEISNVIQRVLGRDRNRPPSGERTMNDLLTMAGNRGDATTLRRLWARLEPDEQLDAAATIAASAVSRGENEGFQLQNFVNWARGVSPEARQIIFGPEASRSIGNLVRITKALQATEGSLNRSRSGVVRNWAGAFRDFTRGGIGGTVLGAVGGGSPIASGAAGAVIGGTVSLGGMALRRLSARSLMSPDLSRWLAAAPRATTPTAIRSHIDRLQVIARTQRNPAIAQEILGLRQGLLNAVNDNASVGMRAAADSGPAGADNRQEQ